MVKNRKSFFNHAHVLWQELADCDLIVGGGDENARTKDLLDFIPDVDGQIIPERVNPDRTKNSHADSFITFLKDSRAVILNGRITPEKNNFTCVSTRGCSVPDYIFCPVENLQNCTEVKTITMSEIINEFKLFPPKTIPDHSVISSRFVLSPFQLRKIDNKGADKNKSPVSNSLYNTRRSKKDLSKINDQFMMGDDIRDMIFQTIEKIESSVTSSNEVNLVWAEIKGIILKEMEKLPEIPKSSNKKQSKKINKGKSFWNEELRDLWNDACRTEKNYLKFKVSTFADKILKGKLRLEFKNAQKRFDKRYRYHKRQFQKK